MPAQWRLVDRKCLQCGTVFQPSQVTTKYCSLACKYLGQRKDETGKRYGTLVVLSRVPDNELAHLHRPQWRCQCDCGKITDVDAEHLRKKKRNCGCKRPVGNKLPKGHAARNQIWTQYKGNATRRGYQWALTKEQFTALTKQNCYYCAKEPSSILARPAYNGDYIYNGIDRVDNTLGYTEKNSVPCCKQCNVAKQTYSKEEFLAWAKRIVDKAQIGI